MYRYACKSVCAQACGLDAILRRKTEEKIDKQKTKLRTDARLVRTMHAYIEHALHTDICDTRKHSLTVMNAYIEHALHTNICGNRKYSLTVL